MDTNGIEALETRQSYITTPVTCSECGDEVEIGEEKLVIRCQDSQKVVCIDHASEGDNIVLVEYHHGFPNNNLHPDTGEPGWLGNDNSYNWYEPVKTIGKFGEDIKDFKQ